MAVPFSSRLSLTLLTDYRAAFGWFESNHQQSKDRENGIEMQLTIINYQLSIINYQ